jgi:chitin disaccharide deacetylase
MTSQENGAFLIVNADDYGYFRCVSRGILKAFSEGIVTATGVFANAAHFAEHAAWLRDCEALDAGVHLNLTEGVPLTNDLRKKLVRTSGHFPRKFPMAMAILSGAVKPDDVRREWRAQIERCLEAGLKPRFLNSHEHLHMLPSLFPVATALASEYAIPHVRFPTSGRLGSPLRPSFVRDAIMKTLEIVNRRQIKGPAAHFLGMETSGRLTPDYLEQGIPRLRAGEVYELMCHPGEFDAQEISDARLRGYHDWEGELRTLTDPAVREVLHRHGVHLIGYRNVEIRTDQLVARQGEG